MTITSGFSGFPGFPPEVPVGRARRESLLAAPRKAGAARRRSARLAETCRGCPARQGGFCGTLPKRLLNRLSDFAIPAVHRADHWFRDRDRPGGVMVVREGYLRLLRYSADGRRLITGIAGPGAIVVETPPGPGRTGGESVTDVSLCTFEHGSFERLLHEDTEFLRGFRAERSRCLAALRQHIWMRGLQSPGQRLAALIVQACGMLPYQPLPGGGGVLTLDIPRADIADLIGTTRETVSRLAHRWQDEGLITISDNQHLILRDRAALARRGGLDPAGQLWATDLPPDVLPPPRTSVQPVRAPAPLRYL